MLAHELGHHSRDHILKTIGWSILLAVPSAFLVAVATRRRGGIYRPEAIPLALLVFVVLTIATTPIQNSLSRRFEAEADWVALETTRDPAAAHDALLKLGDASLEDPDPPSWAQLFFGTHPSVMDRLEMVEAWRRQRLGRDRGLK